MGRPPLPKEVKALRGTTRKDRNELSGSWGDSSITTMLDVKVPKDIKGVAAKIYEERVQMLVACKILQPIDTDALRLYSQAMATAIRAQKVLDTDGFTVVSDKGVEMVHPMVKVLKDAVNTANTIGSQFGWTPIARMRLLVNPADKKKNDFSEFTDE